MAVNETIAEQENAQPNAAGGGVTPASAALPAAAEPAAATPAADSFNPYDYQSRVAEINRMYDANINANKANMEAAYNQNMSDLEANRAKIAQQYQNQRNARAAEYERQRRNFNQQAMMNGLNTGAASQLALGQQNAYQSTQAAIGAAEGNANTQLDKSIADLKIQYQSEVNEAIAKNDYNRAAALLDEYNNAYSMAMTKAQSLAQYGDFSGYSELYGADAANQMGRAWALQNPLLAYNLGRISASEYKGMTGSYPPGYKSSRRSSYGGGSGVYGSGSGNGTGNGNNLDLDTLLGDGGGDGNTTGGSPPAYPATSVASGEARAEARAGNSAIQAASQTARNNTANAVNAAAAANLTNNSIYNTGSDPVVSAIANGIKNALGAVNNAAVRNYEIAYGVNR